MSVFEFIFVLSLYGFGRGLAAAVIGRDFGPSYLIALPEELGKKLANHFGWSKPKPPEKTMLVENEEAKSSDR